MKKKLSLILAAVFVVVTLVSALPFGAFAALPEEAEARIGDKLVSLELAMLLANGSDQDITVTLLKDITLTSTLPINPISKKADGSDVHVTLDGNGHTLTIDGVGNCIQPGGGGGAKGHATVTIKDINISYVKGVGSVIHFYSGGDFRLENVNIDCTTPLDWTAINMNVGNNGADNPVNIDMINVNIKTQSHGNQDVSIMRTGNEATNLTESPYSNIYMENCHFAAIGESTAKNAAIGLHPTSPNAFIEMVNCTVTSTAKTPLYVASGASNRAWGDPVDGKVPKYIGKMVDTEFICLSEDASVGALKRPEWFEWVNTEKNPDTTGKAAVVYDDTGVGIAYDTLPAAVDAANAAISDTKIILCADVDLGGTIITLKNVAKKAIVFDGNNYKITATANNAIKVGADGDTEAKVYFQNLNIDYTGVGSVIQIYAGGEVDLYNVKIRSNGKLNWCAVNALNKAGTELKLNIVDCVITGADDGNNPDAGLVRTGNNGNIVYLNILDSTIIAEAGDAAAAKPITPLNVTSALATVVIDNSMLVATNNSAIVVRDDLAAKVKITNTYLANDSEEIDVLSNEALFDIDDLTVTIEGGPKPEETTPEETTPEATPEQTPEATPEQTPEATPEQTPEATPEATTPKTEPSKGGACGGIAIAAQLAALICAAAAVVIIKKK